MGGRATAAYAAVLAVGAGLPSCTTGGVPSSLALTVPAGLELYVPMPEDNRPTAERVELGERLFFDPLISADRTVSCASCHRPENAFADTVARSSGVHGRPALRNTPSLLNVAWARPLTWDGRSATLEEQVLKPIQDPVEMDLPLEEMVARLGAQRGYRRAFARAYGEPVTAHGVARALSAYLRTLRSGDAPIDRFRLGDADALTPLERQGFELFVGRARCAFCHAGPTLSDGEFHNTGVTVRSGDPGRFAVTGAEGDRGAFRTPTLRNVSRTAPYMHDGSLATLEEVIEFYEGGGLPNANLDPDIRPLRLSADDRAALLAFLGALDGRGDSAVTPPVP